MIENSIEKNIRLCLDLRLIAAPGIGRFLRTMVKIFLIEKNLSVSFLCYAKDLVLIETLDTKNRFKKITCSSRVYSLKEQWELTRKIPDCDVFWSPHFNIPLCLKQARALIVSVHDVFHLTHFVPFYKRMYARLMFRALNKKATKIVTGSWFIYDQYLAFLGKTRVEDLRVVPYSVLSNDRELVSIDERAEYILYVGSLQPRKNVLRLIKAYHILRPKEKLFIVGPKTRYSLDNEVFRCVKNSKFLRDNVEFIDTVSEEKLTEYYSRAKVFVFPSVYEGFGYPPLEAMKLGCPAVVSNIPCLRETCGAGALFFNPYDEKSIADTLSDVLNNKELRTVLRTKGLNHVKQYDILQMKQNILRIIYESSYCS